MQTLDGTTISVQAGTLWWSACWFCGVTLSLHAPGFLRCLCCGRVYLPMAGWGAPSIPAPWPAGLGGYGRLAA